MRLKFMDRTRPFEIASFAGFEWAFLIASSAASRRRCWSARGPMQYIRANWLSIRVFENFDDIVNAGCDAWNRLIDQPETITSIGSRKWGRVGRNKKPLALASFPFYSYLQVGLFASPPKE